MLNPIYKNNLHSIPFVGKFFTVYFWESISRTTCEYLAHYFRNGLLWSASNLDQDAGQPEVVLRGSPWCEKMF